MDNIGMANARRIFALCLAVLGGVGLVSCSTATDPSRFAVVSYYDNNPNGAKLVGIDYVVPGSPTYYRPVSDSSGTTVTYDEIDLSGIIPEVGAYRSFEGWDYGNYPDGTLISDESASSSSSIDISGTKVDPNNVLADCSATPVFDDAFYEFKVTFKDGANYLRRTTVSESGETTRTIIGNTPITVKDLEAYGQSGTTQHIDYPGANLGGGTDDKPTGYLDPGYTSDFLGYGVIEDTRAGYVEGVYLATAYREGEGNPTLASGDIAGGFYVDFSSKGEDGTFLYPLWLCLNVKDSNELGWFHLGDLANSFEFDLEAIFSDTVPEKYDLTVSITDGEGNLRSATLENGIEFGSAVSLGFTYQETSDGTYGVVVNVTSELMSEDTVVSSFAIQDVGYQLSEGYVIDFLYDDAYLRKIEGDVDVAVSLSESKSLVEVTVVDDYSSESITETVYEVEYGEPLYAKDPSLSGHTFLGYTELSSESLIYQKVDVSSITRPLILYPCFGKDHPSFTDYGNTAAGFFYDDTQIVSSFDIKGSLSSGYYYELSDISLTFPSNAPSEAAPVSADWTDYFKENVHSLATNRAGNDLDVTSVGSAFNSLKGAEYSFSFTISSWISNVHFNAFRNMVGLTSITYEEIANRTIAEASFEFCTSLSSVSFLGTGNLAIESYAFRHCDALTMPDLDSLGSVSIDREAFSNCGMLLSNVTSKILELPACISYIGSAAFTECGILGISIDKTEEECLSFGENWNYDFSDMQPIPVTYRA